MADAPSESPAVSCRGLTKIFGSVVAVDRVDVDIQPGEILSLLGPSACGKTTFLRLVAGLERPDAGTIQIGESIVARPGFFLPPERRHIGFVFQDYALFPHLSVAGNVAYGLTRRDSRESTVAGVLSLVGLAGLGERRLNELSGGQQQRVALARALAPAPQTVLLDEPFSNLDADLRERVRSEVRDILRRTATTAVFVTHDQDEAFAVADRVAVMREGAIDQVGRPEEIYHTPATRFVADFVGSAEFLPADVANGRLTTELGAFVLPAADLSPGSAELMLRPEDIHLTSDPTEEAVVVSREFRGPVNLSVVRLPSGRTVTAAHSSQALFRTGERVRVAFRPDHLVIFRGPRRIAWVPARPRTGTDVLPAPGRPPR